MAGADRRRRSRSGRLLDALVRGAMLGAAGGAVLGAAVDGIGAGAGALIGWLLGANLGSDAILPTALLSGALLGLLGLRPLKLALGLVVGAVVAGLTQALDAERDALTVLKLTRFQEEIHVYVTRQELRTDHSFSLGGRRFLTLRYEIERLPDGAAQRPS